MPALALLVFLAALAALHPRPCAASGLPEELESELAAARAQVPGAGLSRLYATITPEGRARCAKSGGLYASWGMLLRTPKGGVYMMVECAARKPMKAFMTAGPPIEGKVIGIVEALAAMKTAGADLAPGSFVSAALEVPEGASASPVWTLEGGGWKVRVDARTGKLLGGAPPPGVEANAALPGRPKKKPANTALQYFSSVKAAAKKRWGTDWLLAVDAITDSDGATPLCAPPSDGWAFYYWVPKLQSVKTLYKCGKDIDEGKEGHVPVDPLKYHRLPDQIVDSFEAMGALAKRTGRAPNRATMRLMSWKKPPVEGQGVLWMIQAGRDQHFVDARDGKYAGKAQK